MKVSVLVAVIFTPLSSSALAAEMWKPTKWEQINQSLEEFLNSGWEPTNLSGCDADGGRFLLRKSGKFAVCNLLKHISSFIALN
jgi:hypothetical protein